MEECEIEEVGKLFLIKTAYHRDQNHRETAQLDYDQSVVDYKRFLDRLFRDVQQGLLAPAESSPLTNYSGKMKDAVRVPVDEQVVQYVRRYLVSHPVSFRSEFEEFDRRNCGKVTSS